MTTSSSTSPFRLTLLKVSNLLTEKNVKDLAFLCEYISPARMQLITNARELFAALQGHDLLNEGKVGVLIVWLEELQLFQASKLLKEYKWIHIKGMTDTSHLVHRRDENKLFVKGHVSAQGNCVIHEDLPLKYLCVTCDSKICPDCHIMVHNKASGCDVINLDKVSDEVGQRREKLMEELELLESGITLAEQRWKEKKECLTRSGELYRNELRKDFFALIEKAERMKRLETEKLDKIEYANIMQVLEEMKETQILQNEVKILSKCHKLSPETALTEIQKIKESTKQIDVLKLQVEKHKDMFNIKTVDLLYRKIPNDGVFCSITVSIVIGSVILRDNQLLHMFDERHRNGCVLLMCIDPTDPSKEYWRHLRKIDNHNDPVVMSNRKMYYGGKDRALFAVGNKVFFARFNWTGSLFDSVESISSLEIDEVHDGSWITSVSAGNPGSDPNDEFVISASSDDSVREYNLSGSALRVMNTRDCVISIARLASCKTMWAIIGRCLYDVIFIDDDGTIRKCGASMLVSSLSGMLPVNIIWTDDYWLVLYISDGVEKVWKVVHYTKTGEFVKVCYEGTSSNEMNVPVSIARYGKNGYITLANATLRTFKFGK